MIGVTPHSTKSASFSKAAVELNGGALSRASSASPAGVRLSLTRLSRCAPSRGWERGQERHALLRSSCLEFLPPGVGPVPPVTPSRRPATHPVAGPAHRTAAVIAALGERAPEPPLLRTLSAPAAAELVRGAPSAPRRRLPPRPTPTAGWAWHGCCAGGPALGSRGRGKVIMRNSLAQPQSRKLTLKRRARLMRHNPTNSEAMLWCYLKGSRLGVGFRRQVVIGEYIVDFCAHSVKLVVEVDGGYHSQRASLDSRRQRRLERAGYRVVRVSHQLVVHRPLQAVARVVAALRAEPRDV